MRGRRRRGGLRPPWAAVAVASACVLAGVACYSFTGGGLPPHIRTVYVLPVENRTAQFELTEPFARQLSDAVRGRLGVQLASRDNADAEIRAEIVRYDDVAGNFSGVEDVGADVFQRRVTVSARVEIVDLTRNEIVWEGSSVNGTAEYAPDSETEETGQNLALENLIQRIIDGAQSQW
ncbi:MAG: LPS assembly lipoprotein LptE [Gemmatimonadota bacterium]